MNNILELIKQRRIWAGLFGTISIVARLFGFDYGIDEGALTDMFLNLGMAVSDLAVAILPIWSYFKPKQ